MVVVLSSLNVILASPEFVSLKLPSMGLIAEDH